MNKVVLIGRLTKDPELKFTQNTGTAVATFNLAVNRRFKKEGQQEADFIPIVVWGKQGESVANYMNKGKLIGVSGRIQTRSYEAKDGSRRFVTEVVSEEIQFLEWGDKNKAKSNTGTSNDLADDYDYSGITPVDDGDIPF
ncbi:single-stranded DNA-binding protein [Clostridium sp. MT-14]|jgi:single-strand DNA-binding protein|uniref:single-stranded DNA-binding protein n=1 Tax=Clostridium sp. MT-14 TaxID=3348360 RepID=UPI0035F4DC81